MDIKSVSVFSGDSTHYCGRGTSYKPKYGVKMSHLGNPFFMKDESLRDAVCDKYKAYFDKNIKSDLKMRTELMVIVEEVRNGKAVRLGCFCKPKRCHCDYLVNRIETMAIFLDSKR